MRVLDATAFDRRRKKLKLGKRCKSQSDVGRLSQHPDIGTAHNRNQTRGDDKVHEKNTCDQNERKRWMGEKLR